jgi:predicted PurR-regulated permease PerM
MSDSKITISLSSIFSILAVVSLIVLLWKLQELVVLVMTAVVIAATLTPLVEWAANRHVPRWLAVLGVYLAAIGSFVGLGVIIGPTVVNQIESLISQIPAYSERLYLRLQDLALSLHTNQPELIPNPQTLLTWGVRSSQEVILRSVDLTKGLVGAVFSVILVLLLSAYMVSDSDSLLHGLAELFPHPWNRRLLAQVKPVSLRMGNFLLGRAIVSAILAVVLTIGLSVLGLSQFALALGVIAGFTNLIPFVGPLLGAIPALVVALSIGGWLWLWVLLLFLVVQNVEGNILTPLLIGSSVKLHPLYMLLAVLGGTEVLGVLGAVIVPPWVAGAAVLLENLYLRPKSLAEARESPSESTQDVLTPIATAEAAISSISAN